MSNFGITSKATTFVDLQRDLQGADAGKHLRAGSSGTSIHTSSSVGGAFMNVLAKIGLPFAKERQETQRQKGAEALEKMIDKDFGNGVGKLVLEHMKNISRNYDNPQGRDYSKGVTVGDLKQIKNLATLFSGAGRLEKIGNKPVESEIELTVQGGDGNTYPVKIDKPTVKVDDKHFIYREEELPTDRNIPKIELPEMSPEHEMHFISLKYNTQENDAKIEIANKEFDMRSRVIARQVGAMEEKYKDLKMDPVTQYIGDFIDEIRPKVLVDIPSLPQVNENGEGGEVHNNKKEIKDMDVDDILNEYLEGKNKPEKSNEFLIAAEKNAELVNNFLEGKEKDMKQQISDLDLVLKLNDEIANDKTQEKKGYVDLEDFDDILKK